MPDSSCSWWLFFAMLLSISWRTLWIVASVLKEKLASLGSSGVLADHQLQAQLQEHHLKGWVSLCSSSLFSRYLIFIYIWVNLMRYFIESLYVTFKMIKWLEFSFWCSHSYNLFWFSEDISLVLESARRIGSKCTKRKARVEGACASWMQAWCEAHFYTKFL